MSDRYFLHQEDRVYLQHIERTLWALLKRTTNTPEQTEALAALLTGLWNLPLVTPGLACALEYCPTGAAMRFEINSEVVSFSYGTDFHASFWVGNGGCHVGSRWGENSDRHADYHAWKVRLEMFESGLGEPETPFLVELISRPTLENVSSDWAVCHLGRVKG